ncbi:MAG: ribosome-recycling factor [Patescibacteria group bacterium]
MNYDFIKLKEEIKNIEVWLAKEFSNLRTSVTSITILDGVKAENYGNLTPLNQMANIITEDAKTMRVSPWDSSQIKEVEKAIIKADLGASLRTDEKGVRLFFPELTGERREELVKTAKNKIEQAKISLRAERDKVWSDIQVKEKSGEVSQDEKFTLKDKMQKIVDDAGKKFVEMFEKKEKEIIG